MPKGLKKGQLWTRLSRDPLMLNLGDYCWLEPWVLATDPTQIWDHGLKKSGAQTFKTR